MSILLALKRATATSHARAELAFPSPTEFADPAVYRDVLTRLHRFYLAWEPAVWASVEVRALLHGESATRRKLSLLEADLACAGPLAQWADPIAAVGAQRLSPLAALGALYVMEGSTLGGRVILTWLPTDMESGSGLGTSFFRGYGARTGEMWREFSRRMEAHVAIGGGTDEILAGAIECFHAVEAAMHSRASDARHVDA